MYFWGTKCEQSRSQSKKIIGNTSEAPVTKENVSPQRPPPLRTVLSSTMYSSENYVQDGHVPVSPPIRTNT